MVRSKTLRLLSILILFLGLGLSPGQTHSQTLTVSPQAASEGYWTEETPIPEPVTSHAVVAYEDSLYSFGYNGSYHYDPVSDTWTALPQPPFDIGSPYDGCVGYNSQGQAIIVLFPSEYSRPIMAYNIARNRWEQRSVPSPLPDFFLNHDIASDPGHNTCYITGGQVSNYYQNTLYAYYPATNTAQQLPSFTTPRAYHASWFISQWGEGGYLCIAGGLGSLQAVQYSTQCYDISQGVWHAEDADMASLPYGWDSMADALTVVDGGPRPWLLGGVLNALNTNKAMYYDASLDAWVEGPHLPYAVVDMEGDALDDEIYVVGGYYFDPGWIFVDYNQHYVPQPLPTCTETPVFFDDFEGAQQWTSSGSSSLWHTEPQNGVCGLLVAPFPSAHTTWYFGDEDYGCTYDVYYANGYLTLDTTLPITGARYATVRFWSYEQTECEGDLKCPFDVRFLDASYDGGETWTHLWRGESEGSWYPTTVSTHVDPGDSLRLRFNFDSVGTSNNNYLGWFIDNVEVTGCFEQPAQTWFEEDDPAIAYSGLWKSLACAECSGGGQNVAARRGAAAEFSFTGTGVRWYMTKASMLGAARVYLDGVDLGFVDLYSPTPQYQQVWETTGLAPGAHTLKIEVSGKKHPRSNGRAITLDALEVTP